MMIPTALFTAALMQTAASPPAPSPAPSPAPAPDLGWMSGYWLDCSDGREASEMWSDPRHGLMVGAAITVRAGRVGFEHARIAVIDGRLAYAAQPDGAAATVFPLAESSTARVVFQNPDPDDYPHRILYERTGDVLSARIEGRIDGRERAADWRFEKAELNARCPIP